MADALSEFRDALSRLAEREITGIISDQGFAPGRPTLAPNNPFGASIIPSEDGGLGTGYDGTNTVLPAIWNLDTFNDGSAYSGS